MVKLLDTADWWVGETTDAPFSLRSVNILLCLCVNLKTNISAGRSSNPVCLSQDLILLEIQETPQKNKLRKHFYTCLVVFLF